MSKACQFVTLSPGGKLHLSWRYPHRRKSDIFDAADLAPPSLVEGKDDEGGSYYHARLALPDGRQIDLAEGHDRARCEAACEEFRAAAGSSD